MAPFGVGSLVLIRLPAFDARDHHLELRGVSPQWALFAEILTVGVPGLIKSGITNLSVALLTGIASHLGREAAIGYAMGARLEYILIPIGFGFGTAISAMVGTKLGRRAISPCAFHRLDKSGHGRGHLCHHRNGGRAVS